MTAAMARMGWLLLALTFLTATVWTAVAARPAAAHEVRPAIADIIVADGAVTLQIDLNLEAFIAQIDLDGLSNTNDAENGAAYDRLRALPPAELEAAFRAFWPRMQAGVTVTGPDGPATLTIADLVVPPVGDVETPRDSVLTLTAPVVAPVTVSWARAYGALILRQQGVDPEAAFTGYLVGGQASPPISGGHAGDRGAVATVLRYAAFGFHSVAPRGADHVLFVLGLCLLAPRIGPVLWQVAAFMLAQIAALSLGALGVVTWSAAVVQLVIALSVVTVAIENLARPKLAHAAPGYTTPTWWRLPLIFGFGVAHGLGFASALTAEGLPDGQAVLALVGFMLGVEGGLLGVIAAVLALLSWCRHADWCQARIATPISLAIAAVGAYWVFERIL